LARLALMTARPPRVFIRTKNPWVLALRVFDGWYVLFMVFSYSNETLSRQQGNLTLSQKLTPLYCLFFDMNCTTTAVIK